MDHNNSNPFVDSCVVPLGLITINGVNKLVKLTSGKLNFDKTSPEEVSVAELNQRRTEERKLMIAKAASGEGDQSQKIRNLIQQLKEQERINAHGDRIQDNGVNFFRGTMSLAQLKLILGQFHRGQYREVKTRKGMRPRIMLFTSKSEDPGESSVAGKIRHHVGKLPDDLLVRVNLWLNENVQHDWLRYNLVIEDWGVTPAPAEENWNMQFHLALVEGVDYQVLTVNPSDAVAGMEQRLEVLLPEASTDDPINSEHGGPFAERV